MDADATATPVRTIGPYALVRRLGEGGMGRVYLANDASGRRVALKVMRPELATEANFQRRFQKEAEAARRVARFCTAPVLDAGVDNGQAYLVTEYVDGPDLAAVVEAQGPMTGGNLEALAVGVATALVAIHQADVVHRDLKPSNILLSPLGPRVIDFGIAQLADTLGTQSVIGTPAYMSPEHANGERVTAASDVFAWAGVIAYSGTGRPPFGVGGPAELLYRIVHNAPRLDGLDERLLPLVERALDKDPARRPTAQQVLDRLLGREKVAIETATEVVSDIWDPVEGPATSLAADALRERRQRQRWVAAAAVLAAVAVVAVVLLVVLRPGGVLDQTTEGDPLAQSVVSRNGYSLHVRIDSLRRVGKTVTVKWSVRYEPTDPAGIWEPGNVFGQSSNGPFQYSTDGVVLIDTVNGVRHPTANQNGCLCSPLYDKRWKKGETAPFYNSFTDVQTTAVKADVDIPSLGLFDGLPIETK
ncbi:serine/threonine-protein kinase [Acrocarpospora sp. B8E8]|uniref:serine/threonine-protein kinase n=1 Tax=Acrocarpospora sp. B8E8 TaxID=3153572 RepID=UPI00325F80BD